MCLPPVRLPPWRSDRHVRRRLLAVCVLVLAMAASPRTGRAQEPTVEQVLASLDRYFDTYRLALGALVAEERMVQQTGGRQLDRPNSPAFIAITREIVSDVAFVDLPAEAGWLDGSLVVAYLNRLADLVYALARWQEGAFRPVRTT